MPQDSLVIIPTFNEKDNIGKIVRKTLSLPGEFNVLVIDDSSPDGTAQIVKDLMPEYPGRLFIMERKGKQGLGTAYIAGFRWALERKYEYIFEMDADFSHNPDDLPRLKEACVNGADLAIGSRYIKGGKVENWPTDRLLMSYIASLYVRLVLWINVRDTTAGFKCYRRRVLEAIPFGEIKFMGYAFQIEMKYLAAKKGFKITEVPITFVDRKEGVSKMSTRIFKEAFWGVIQMRFSNYGG
ncbi:MAG: polyprenol monophosphomannose synthase [Bacteroidia bacterium]|nr:polyprenol monophosphomannose synthase [Bacteroidia bacterium]